jgi:hypothetical protein
MTMSALPWSVHVYKTYTLSDGYLDAADVGIKSISVPCGKPVTVGEMDLA